MQTKQIIQTSANVIRITNLVKGNIYKRFDNNYSWFGVVKGIFNDGNNTVIEATEYRSGWNSLEVQDKVIKGEDDCVIFPATIEDFQVEFSKCVDRLKSDIEKAKETIIEKDKQIVFTEKLISGEMQKELSEPEFKSLTQQEFNEKLKEIAA